MPPARRDGRRLGSRRTVRSASASDEWNEETRQRFPPANATSSASLAASARRPAASHAAGFCGSVDGVPLLTMPMSVSQASFRGHGMTRIQGQRRPLIDSHRAGIHPGATATYSHRIRLRARQAPVVR